MNNFVLIYSFDLAQIEPREIYFQDLKALIYASEAINRVGCFAGVYALNEKSLIELEAYLQGLENATCDN
jgi:hypothetical protein